MTVNKLPEHLENPIDAVILCHTEILLPLFRATGHTPNMITLYSFLCGVLSIWALWSGNVVAFVVAYGAGYVLDCVDGQFARAYDMVSTTGDVLDHLTDVVVLVGVLLVAARRYRRTPGAGFVGVGLGVLLVLMLLHFGNQQLHYRQGQKRESLDVLGTISRAIPVPITVTRWFGCGTFHLALVLSILALEHKHRKAKTAGVA